MPKETIQYLIPLSVYIINKRGSFFLVLDYGEHKKYIYLSKLKMERLQAQMIQALERKL